MVIEKRGRGNVSDKIDRDLLYEFLWKHRDRNGFMPWGQAEFGEMLNLTVTSVSVIFRELREKGAIVRVRNKVRIVDPELSKWGSLDDR